MKILLSNQQQKVVDYNGKNLLVIAGAGSGKTRVLTERIKRLIKSLKKGEKVLAITFSNKASDELRERLVSSIGEDNLEASSYIGTTHKFFLDIVTSRGNLIGLPDDLHICEAYDDRLQILKEAIENIPQFKNQYLTSDPKENLKNIRSLLEELSMEKRNLAFYRNIEEDNKKKVFEEYDSLLLQQGIIDFDDILCYAFQILTERISVANIYRKIYKFVCIDEGQDLNKAQYEAIKALAGDEMGITIVGDPKQSIYGFNGSSSDYFEKEFLADYKAEKIELDENYRSSRKVLQAANIIEKSFELRGVYPIEGECKIFSFPNDTEEAEFIYKRICDLQITGHSDIENNSISLNQCAVIARNRYVFTKLEKILTDNKIEYTLRVSAKGSFSSESDMMKAFELGMRLLVNSRDKIHLDELSKLVGSHCEGSSFNELRADKCISNHWKTCIKTLNVAWDILTKYDENIRFFKSLEIIQKFADDLDENADEFEKVLIDGDIKVWKDNWDSYVKKSMPGERSLGNFVRTVSLGSAYIPQDKGVVLSTVHMTKGLEYDVVFIMGLNEGVFPDYRAVNASNFGHDNKQLDEERHNMFVAITRSKRLCYLTYPIVKDTPWGKKGQIESRYIKELRDKLL